MSCIFRNAAWALALVSLTGCATVQSCFAPPVEGPPLGVADQVQVAWENRVMVTQDVVNNGAPLVGIAGRLYLFGQGVPVIGDGSAVVDLFDVTPETTQGAAKMLERWEIDRETLRRLARKDLLGWGYTVFLPWSTYRPDVTRVQIQVRYLPDKGLPLYSKPAAVVLRNEAPPTVTETRQVVAGAKAGRAAVGPAANPAGAPTATFPIAPPVAPGLSPAAAPPNLAAPPAGAGSAPGREPIRVPAPPGGAGN